MTVQRRRTTKVIVSALAVVLLLAAAGIWFMRTRSSTAGPRADGKVPSAAQALELTAGDVARAQRAELVRTLAVSGGLRALDSAIVKARVSAEVQQLLVREGDRVGRGQLIGRLDGTEFQLRLRQAEDQARAAQAQLDIAQRTLDNNKALVDQGFISRNALDTSASSAAGARASLQAAQAAADIARKAVRDSEIRAPLAGLVAQRFVQPGERVGLDARLVEIVDLSRIELEAAVAPEDVPALRVGQAVGVQIDGLEGSIQGRVLRIAPSTQAGTRAVMTYVQLQPHPALRQGLFARGTIELQRQAALVVPASAVRFDQARPYVLVVEGGKAAQRSVVLGQRGDVLFDGRPEAAVEVTEGVAEGAVVLRGSVGSLRDGTLLQLPPLPTAGAASAAPAAGRASPSASAAAAR